MQYKLLQLVPEGITAGEYFLLSYNLGQDGTFSQSDVSALEEALSKGWYKHVGTFEYECKGRIEDHLRNCEEIFKVTQNGIVFPSWSRAAYHPMTFTAPLRKTDDGKVYGHRSTSTGDIIEFEDGRRFLCASFGFKEIKIDPAKAAA